jgi:hypothetical protein
MQRQALNRRHRLIGIILLLPFLAWSATGVFFLVRPGFAEAYERIPVRRYALPQTMPVAPQEGWRELRYFRSVLGDHLIVQTEDGWQHRHAETGQSWSLPNEDDLTRLLQDAFAFNPDRYGRIVAVDGSRARTDTGVSINIAWDTLAISQNGRDSRWIDRIYSIHYLEWTGFYWTDRILGLGGLALLIYMTYTGALMAFGRQRQPAQANPDAFD